MGNYTRRPSAVVLSIGLCVISFLLLSCGTSKKDRVESPADPDGLSQTPSPSPNCQLPRQAPGPNSSSIAFAHFAWQQFSALNWPAGRTRGQPACENALGSSGPTVWQTFKTTDQVFLPDAQDPGPWRRGERLDNVLTLRAKADPSLPVESSVRQAVGGWLTDRNGNPTYYSISLNEASYDYVVENAFYNANTVGQASAVTFPEGALEVKAAWRIMTPQDDESRFLTMDAQVMTYDSQGQSTGQTQAATVGLVGLHLVYKAPGFPQWVWATFEQVDNTDLSHGGHASYYNPDCSGPYCTPNQSPLTTGQAITVPTQVTRVAPVTDEIAQVNQAWQRAVAGTVFEHYQLISPQWPADPQDPGNPQGTPTPGTVANVVMESYIQPTSSCMDCHSTARVPGGGVKSNYSFIFLFAERPQGRDAQGGQQ